MKSISLVLGLLLGSTAFAANVAIVDSGTDFSHASLNGRAWVNPGEIAGNLVDDDRNKKVDDVVGWNFAENYGRVFYGNHTTAIAPITYKIFEVLAHQQAGTSSPDDLRFWEENVTSLPAAQKTALLAHLNYYGQYAHGTHVSGIVAALSPQSRLMSARVFADSLPEGYEHRTSLQPFALTDVLYKFLATMTNGMFDQVAQYLGEKQMDVANYSLGVPLQMIAKSVLALRGINNPTPEQLSEETKKAFKQYGPKGLAWMKASPKTLFVIAAGNDGTDNDALPAFPANVRAPNAITVAASSGFNGLAKFSNYGIESVDVAAPGVAIRSSVPATDHTMMLPMSGTSMAAPYVTGVAAAIKDVNPALTAEQIRAILMGTVDLKAWLKGKVISGGVVNKTRAYVAAAKAKTVSLEQAIGDARVAVADVPETATGFAVQSDKAPNDLKVFADTLLF